MILWGSDECIKKSEINAKNRCAGHETAAGTHTGCSISMGEYRKKLAIEKGRIQYQGSYICTSIRMVMMENLLLMSVLELSMKNMTKYCGKKQCLKLILINVKHFIKLWGEKRREEYTVLVLKAKSYYGQKLSASSSVLPSISQSTPITNMDEFVKQMLPALTNHFRPVMVRVQEGSTPIDNPSTVTPLVPLSATTNEDEVDP